MAKLFFYDTETTGVKYWRNGIHQISAIIEIDGVVKESINLNPRPNPKAEIELGALEIGNVTREQIMEYEDMKSVHSKLVSRLEQYVDKFNPADKFFLVGYNNRSFDDSFLRAWFTQCGDKYFGSWFWSSGIDVMVLAAQILMDKRADMENFKLMTVAKYLGIEIDEFQLHDAFYDVTLTRQVYMALGKLIRGNK